MTLPFPELQFPHLSYGLNVTHGADPADPTESPEVKHSTHGAHRNCWRLPFLGHPVGTVCVLCQLVSILCSFFFFKLRFY